ncbi:MAG TPA: nitrate reductase molybdenum cofactor assembly chaperone [Bacillota bacterium]|nr:nitrate reductase molybdenum cofactor assembly chaperone [Bacillota bacterium]
MEELSTSLEIASALLLYPTEWNSQIEEIQDLISSIEHEQTRKHLESFLDTYLQANKEDWIESYVQTVDFGKQTNLYLTYAEHGEQKERGTVLLELKELFTMNGFNVVDEEMPDYLPLILEFCAHAPIDAIRWVIDHYQKVIKQKQSEFQNVDSPYWHIIASVLSIWEAYGLNPIVKEEDKQ